MSAARGPAPSVGKWWPSGKPVKVDDWVTGDARARAVLGMTRQGKGELLKKVVVPALLAAGRSVVVVDVDDEYSVHGKERAANSLGPLPLRVDAPGFKSWLVANEKAFRGPRLGLSIVPVSKTDDAEELASQVGAVLPFLKARGDVDVVFEELPRWASANGKVEALLKVVATGWLKEGVRPWFVAQGYRFIPIDTRSQVSEVFTFRQVDSADVRFVGLDCGRGFAREMIVLPKGHFRARDRGEADPDLLQSLSATSAGSHQEG